VTATRTRLGRILPGILLLALCAPALAEEPRQVGGRYSVKGVTVDETSGGKREISGIISLNQTGASFTSHSELKTVTPGTDATQAEVIGTGQGTITGDTLKGSAEIQLISSDVAGLDVSFGLAPISATSRRIRSTWDATVDAEGNIRVESVNIAAEGEAEYRPTRTTLHGKRIAEEPARAE